MVVHPCYCSVLEIERDPTWLEVARIYTKVHIVHDEAELILVSGINPKTLELSTQLRKVRTSSRQLAATKGSHHA